MSQVLHTIEKQIIKSLQKNPTQTTEELVEITKLSIDQVRRGMEWLRLKGLADIKESKKTFVSLGQKGLEASKSGLPERKLLELIKNNPRSFKEIQEKLP
ncbi:MAG: phenylalanine--tRNA ligase subunit alpha, partial [Nitrosopumilaceae archaeon]